jgi:hypothetical protein
MWGGGSREKERMSKFYMKKEKASPAVLTCTFVGKTLGSERGKVLGRELCHGLKKKVKRNCTVYLLSEIE